MPEGDALHFRPLPPPLLQKAGARPAFWTYYWEFGDGNFSREEAPQHRYAAAGEYPAILYATPHYDDGKIPDKKGKGIMATLGNGLPEIGPDAFTERVHSLGSTPRGEEASRMTDLRTRSP